MNTYWEQQIIDRIEIDETASRLHNLIDNPVPTFLLFGGRGGIGSRLTKILPELGYVVSLSSKDVNIEDSSKVAEALSLHKPDVVINLASINIDGLIVKYIESDLEKMLDTNIKGAFNVSQESLKYFKENKIKGNLIYISSILSQKPIVGTGTYSACKAFNDSLVKTSALEGSRYGIRVNSIALGYFNGGMTESVPENILTQVMSNIPMSRLGESRDLLSAIEFLVKCEYITGASIPLSGGLQLV